MASDSVHLGLLSGNYTNNASLGIDDQVTISAYIFKGV
jgi:hypothetical protein